MVGKSTQVWWIIGILVVVLLVSTYSLQGIPFVEERESYRIGVALPITGFAAVNGEADAMAVALAVEKINNAGGINGIPIELIVEDYESDAKKVALVYRKLIEVDEVDVIIGPVWTVFAEVGAPIANEAQIPTIMVDGDAKYETLVGYGDYFFTTWYPVFGGHDDLINYIISSGETKVSIVYDNGSPYSLEMRELFHENALENGLDVVSEHELAFGETDFRAEITRLGSAGAEVVYAPLSSPQMVQSFMKQSVELGIDDVEIVGVEFSWDALLQDVYPVWEGDIIFAFPEPNRVREAEFYQRFEERYGGPIERYPSSIKNSYDAVFMLAEALAQNPKDGAELRSALLDIKDFEGVSGESLSFDTNGIVNKPDYVLKVYGVDGFIPLN